MRQGRLNVFFLTAFSISFEATAVPLDGVNRRTQPFGSFVIADEHFVHLLKAYGVAVRVPESSISYFCRLPARVYGLDTLYAGMQLPAWLTTG